MKRKRTLSWPQRLFCLLMALHVLNFSVNPPDQHTYITASGAVREDLSVNEMESVTEWVLEHVFGIDVAEHDELDHEGRITKSFIKLFAPKPLSFTLLPSTGDSFVSYVSVLFVAHPYRSVPADVLSPPPWLV